MPEPIKRGPRNKWPFGDMEVGDSVFIPVERENVAKKQTSLGSLLWHKKPKKFTVRVVDGGLRVWRTE